MHERSSGSPGPAAAALVQGLEDLHRGVEIQLRLIGMGEEAVGALGSFLLGPPALHPQPRILAAEALGAIGGPGATRALLTALTTGDLASLPLVYRLSEEAVRNHVARALGRLGDPSAVEPLLDALGRFHLVEAGAALLVLGEVRAVPLLVACLRDDFLRERATTVLAGFGRRAVVELIAGLEPSAGPRAEEWPGSVAGRATCARLLGAAGDARATTALRACLDDRRQAVRIAAAVSLVRLAAGDPGMDVIPPLIEGLCGESPAVVDDCADALASLGGVAVRALAVAFIGEAGRDEQAGLRMPRPATRALARTLGRIADAGGEALEQLADHPAPFVRALALANLGRTGPERATPVLARALRDPDRRVRRTAAARLGQLGARRHA